MKKTRKKKKKKKKNAKLYFLKFRILHPFKVRNVKRYVRDLRRDGRI
jgi:hypothetical protein